MPTPDINTIFANEARRQELRLKIAKHQGTADSSAQVVSILASLNNDTVMLLSQAQGELMALEAGAGPGVTAFFGQKSNITQMAEQERNACVGAVVDLIKTTPTVTESQAADAWNTAATLAHTAFPYPLHNAMSISQLYRANLFAKGLIPAATWEDQKTWVIATDKAVILAL